MICSTLLTTKLLPHVSEKNLTTRDRRPTQIKMIPRYHSTTFSPVTMNYQMYIYPEPGTCIQAMH